MDLCWLVKISFRDGAHQDSGGVFLDGPRRWVGGKFSPSPVEVSGSAAVAPGNNEHAAVQQRAQGRDS